jgi:hypothetical protein
MMGASAQGQTFIEKWRVPSSVPANSASLSDHGWAVWTTRPDANNNTFLFDGTTLLGLGVAGADNLTARINNNHFVVWSARRVATDPISPKDIYLWKPDLSVTNLSLLLNGSGTPTINNLNDTAWSAKNPLGDDDLYFLAHNGSAPQTLTVTDDTGNSTRPILRDDRSISWERLFSVQGDMEIAFSTVPSMLQAVTNNQPPPFTYASNSGGGNPNLINCGFNKHGVIVWQEYDLNANFDHVWMYDPATGTRTRLSAGLPGHNRGPVINDDGVVVWENNIPSGANARSKLFWYTGTLPAVQVPDIDQSGRFNRPVALNNTGGLLFASGSGSAYNLIFAQRVMTTSAVTGFVTLEGIVPTAEAQDLTFTFRPSDNSAAIVRVAKVAAEGGGFAFTGLPKKQYTLHITGRKWLARNVAVDASNGNAHGVLATLLPGELTGDNLIDLFDLIAFFESYGDTATDPNWNELADCNCDGIVDLFDLILFFSNYGQAGDP